MGVQFPGKKRYVTLEWPQKVARDIGVANIDHNS